MNKVKELLRILGISHRGGDRIGERSLCFTLLQKVHLRVVFAGLFLLRHHQGNLGFELFDLQILGLELRSHLLGNLLRLLPLLDLLEFLARVEIQLEI